VRAGGDESALDPGRVRRRSQAACG
jgi:hypothetical protein